MSAAKHTPGPWAACARQGDDWDSVVAVPNTPHEICQCFHDPVNTEECSANARLIAAAPDLLAALEKTKGNGCWCDVGIGHPLMSSHSEGCKSATAAVAKARGES